jgi:hypothetical protein
MSSVLFFISFTSQAETALGNWLDTLKPVLVDSGYAKKSAESQTINAAFCDFDGIFCESNCVFKSYVPNTCAPCVEDCIDGLMNTACPPNPYNFPCSQSLQYQYNATDNINYVISSFDTVSLNCSYGSNASVPVGFCNHWNGLVVGGPFPVTLTDCTDNCSSCSGSGSVKYFNQAQCYNSTQGESAYSSCTTEGAIDMVKFPESNCTGTGALTRYPVSDQCIGGTVQLSCGFGE